jgi:hypothetical protein
MNGRSAAVRRLFRIFIILALALALAGCTTQVRVEWTTESELNTAGFNLYRGESPDGPFPLKVNDALIPASPDPLVGGEYLFVDKAARPGATYYYQLEEVEKSGVTNTYGPVEAHSSGLDWRHALILGLLAGVAIYLWVSWGAKSSRARPFDRSTS